MAHAMSLEKFIEFLKNLKSIVRSVPKQTGPIVRTQNYFPGAKLRTQTTKRIGMGSERGVS